MPGSPILATDRQPLRATEGRLFQTVGLAVDGPPASSRYGLRYRAPVVWGSALRSARFPVNLIGAPINYANRLIGSPITSQSTGLGPSSQMYSPQTDIPYSTPDDTILAQFGLRCTEATISPSAVPVSSPRSEDDWLVEAQALA
jgi:hypothetical protein